MPSADTPCTLVLHISDDAFAQPIVTECHRVPTTTGHRDQPSLCLRAEGDRPWAYPCSLSVLRMLLWRNQQEAPVRAEKIAPQYGAAREGLSARRRGSRPSGLSGKWSSGRKGGPTHPRVKGRAGQAGHRGRAVQVDSWWPTGMSTRALPVVVPHKCPSHQEPGVADSRSQLRQHRHWRGLSLGQLSNSHVTFPHFQ